MDRLQAETLLQFAQAVGALVEQLLADCRQIDRLGFALEHGPPIGAVGDLAAQQVFHQAGLLAGGHAQDRQRLARAWSIQRVGIWLARVMPTFTPEELARYTT